MASKSRKCLTSRPMSPPASHLPQSSPTTVSPSRLPDTRHATNVRDRTPFPHDFGMIMIMFLHDQGQRSGLREGLERVWDLEVNCLQACD